MDKIIKITAGLFLVVLAIFVAQGWYGNYVEQKYKDTLVSTYIYDCTISASEKLTNVTFLIPVPVNGTGDSQLAEDYSLRQVSGLPPEWRTTIVGSNKGAVIKIVVPELAPSIVTLHLDVPVAGPIETKSPLAQGILFRPVLNPKKADCAASAGTGAICYRYDSTIYATYDSSQSARVAISSTLVGKNTWTIFAPASNQYSTSISATINGPHRRWIDAPGELQTGIGSYDVPNDS